MKKLISILLILLLGFVNSEKSYAITLPEDKEDIMDYVYALLQTVEMEKEVYGLEGIELDCLDLGSEIPAFITTYEGLVRQEQLHFLPVLYHEQWVGTLVSSNNKYEELTVEYTRDYSNVTSKAYPIV